MPVVHDWHAGVVVGDFDVLLLADVTYRPVHHRPVLRQMEACLAGGGVALHADPYRREVEGFLVQARAAFVHREIEASTHWDGKRLPVRIHAFAAAAPDLERWLPQTALDTGVAPGDSSPPSAATQGPPR
jgi:2-polyprenyl-3-methyl-5-hydroxy-6-metoxy-1,4-benzoquinol methylase